MKKIFSLLVASTLCLAGFSQEKKMDKMDKTQKMENEMKDCVMMKDGKMMVMKGSDHMMMEKEMTMTNGTMVMTDGTIKMKDGTTKMMKENECIYMDGKMGKMHHKMDKKKMTTGS